MSSRDIYQRGFYDEVQIQILEESSCPECDGVLRTEDGELGCVECGLIVSEYRLDHTGKRVAFRDSETNPERTGAPLTPTLHDRGLSTEIGTHRDGKGNLVPFEKRRRLGRLKTQQSRAKWGSKADRNLGRGLGEVARMCSALELSGAVRDRACDIFREAQRETLLRGRSIEGIAAASVFAACRCLSHTRTLGEVIEVSQASESDVTTGYRVLNVELGLRPGILRPRDFVPRFASECDVPNSVRARAQKLATLAEERGLSNGRKPSGVAAAALYLAADEQEWPLTQSEAAAVANTTAVTVRQRCYELLDVIE